MGFVVGDFIRESNKIDKQFDSAGLLIPGAKPGDLMYDNQVRAIELFPCLIKDKPISKNLILTLHRELTRGVDVLEQQAQSGCYRKIDVYIGGAKSPLPILAKSIIEEILLPTIEKERGKPKTESEALKFAWWCHDLFECAHPFIDGNGRTGRLLLNFILELFGYDKKVIYYEDRFDYYAHIQKFRKKIFSKLLHTER